MLIAKKYTGAESECELFVTQVIAMSLHMLTAPPLKS